MICDPVFGFAIFMYLVIGAVLYGFDVFERRSWSFENHVTYALIGGLVLLIRVTRQGYRVLVKEVAGKND